MSAVIVDIRQARAERIALAKAARISSLAEELGDFPPGEPRDYMVELYLSHGWMTDSEAQLALEALGEVEG